PNRWVSEEVVHAGKHGGAEASVFAHKPARTTTAQRARLYAGGDPGGHHHHWSHHGAGRAARAELPDRIESENRANSNPELRERAGSLLSRRRALPDQRRRTGRPGATNHGHYGVERSLSEGRNPAHRPLGQGLCLSITRRAWCL